MVRVDALAACIGSQIEATFSDGWDDWRISGRLLSVEEHDHLFFIEVCEARGEQCDNCDDPNWRPGDHGAYGFSAHDPVEVHY